MALVEDEGQAAAMLGKVDSFFMMRNERRKLDALIEDDRVIGDRPVEKNRRQLQGRW